MDTKQGHCFDPTLCKTTVSHAAYLTGKRGWFIVTEHENTEGLRHTLQTGPHTLDEIEDLLKVIQNSRDPNDEDCVLEQKRVVEDGLLRWIEGAAQRLAEQVQAENDGDESAQDQSPVERVWEIVEAGQEYSAWCRT